MRLKQMHTLKLLLRPIMTSGLVQCTRRCNHLRRMAHGMLCAHGRIHHPSSPVGRPGLPTTLLFVLQDFFKEIYLKNDIIYLFAQASRTSWVRHCLVPFRLHLLRAERATRRAAQALARPCHCPEPPLLRPPLGRCRQMMLHPGSGWRRRGPARRGRLGPWRLQPSVLLDGGG